MKRMNKTILRGILLGLMLAVLIGVPVMAAYYAYIYVEESDGNSYEELPIICSANVTQLVAYDFISSTGLDTRVLTGDGYPLPHMLADDKMLFVTDLEAYEEKTLIFYPKATSLSSFPIIVGYNGSVTTSDDEDLELGYVLELLTHGYFDASAGSDKNVVYKQEAFRVWISDTDTIRVAALNASEDEQWAMEYDSFTSGVHTLYVVANGLGALLYVDDLEVAKDTENLFESSNVQLSTSGDEYLDPYMRRTFYANDLYWAFYGTGGGVIYYKTSGDGLSWSSVNTISLVSGDTNYGFGVWQQGSYMHIAYGGRATGTDHVRYRHGVPEATGNITWSAGWQTAVTFSDPDAHAHGAGVAVDNSGYPYVAYKYNVNVSTTSYVTKSSTNNGTWTTAGGYPKQLNQSSPNTHHVTVTPYLNANKMYVVWNDRVGDIDEYSLFGLYYNGSSWAGTADTISYLGSGSGAYQARFSAIADSDDNLYIVWEQSGHVYLRIRYADGSFGSAVLVSSSASSPSVTYNADNGYVYIGYIKAGAIRYSVLANDTISGEWLLFTTDADTMSATPYGDHIGVLFSEWFADTQHGYIAFPWDWNDNSNDYKWMQNNIMPYASYIMLGVDGELALQYQPETIVNGTTLPDVSENGQDGIITWGSNPDGVDVSISGMQSDRDEEEYYYYPYTESGSTDIIKPEPGAMGGDVDLDKLENNPLNPLVQVIEEASDGQLTARLIWLCGAIFLLIAAMITVQLKTEHIMLASLTGLGLSTLFYVFGIFPLWVVILLIFGLVASIIYERMPVL